jgi:hypothetical protein
MLNKYRVYIENSVIGGYFDKEFEVPTRKLFDKFSSEEYIAVEHILLRNWTMALQKK